jgi:hypothetical protein
MKLLFLPLPPQVNHSSLKQFLINEFSNGKTFKVLYIVPSRALINQVNEEFKIEINQMSMSKTSLKK